MLSESELLAMPASAYMSEARLLLRPTATLCIEAKERQEQRERHIRDVRGTPNG